MEYFVSKDGQKLGPYSRDQVRQMLAEGAIQQSDPIWTAAATDWGSLQDRADDAPSASRPDQPGRIEPSLSAAARPSATPSAGQLSLNAMYEAFVGPARSDYYLPLFQRFDAGGSSVSWNWASAFVASLWMLYRGMYLWGFLLYPVLRTLAFVGIVVGVVAAMGRTAGGFAYLAFIPATFVVMGMFGNKIYHGHVRKLIDRSATLGLPDQLRRDWLIRKGAANGIVVIFIFMVPAVVGVLAAIAIPAYQDYTIRSQVAEGAVLADGAKSALVEYYSAHDAFPPGNASAGLESPASISGKYVSSVAVSGNLIDVTFGGQANRLVAGHVLEYSAAVSPDGKSMTWHCDTQATNIPNKFLPTVCRK